MSVRLLICLVLAPLCGMLPRTACAQAMPWNRGTGTLQQEVPASHANGPHDPFGATSYPNWNAQPIASQGQWYGDTVDGDAYSYGQPGHLGYPDTYGYPPGVQGPYGPGAGGVGYAPEHSPQYQFAPQAGAAGGPAARTIHELLPEDRGLLYDEDINRLLALRDRMRTSWFRMEYLNFDMRNPGNTLLGAPVAGIDNPRDPFLVTAIDNTGSIQTIGTARVMDMTPVDLQHMQGSRISFGLPTQRGEFEGSFWGIAAVSRFRAPELAEADPFNVRVPQSQFDLFGLTGGQSFVSPIPFLFSQRFFPLLVNQPQNPNAVFVATSLRQDDEPSPLLVLYDADFSVKYNIKTWGSEANMLWDLRNPVDGWILRALAGFRYTSHQEELIQQGIFNNQSSIDQTVPIIGLFDPLSPVRPNLVDPPIVNEIASRTENDFFGGQIGFKTEWSNPWIAVGATPKIALGANRYTATVTTRDLRDSPDLRDPANPATSILPSPQDDGITISKLKSTHWSPAFDLGLYARLNLTDWASVHVGYNLIWMHNLARADEVIYYNDTGLTNPPGIVVQQSREDLWVRGISIGGQITLPK